MAKGFGATTPNALSLKALQKLEPGAHLVLYRVHRSSAGTRRYFLRVTYRGISNSTVLLVRGWRTLREWWQIPEDLHLSMFGMATPPYTGNAVDNTCSLVLPEHIDSLPQPIYDVAKLNFADKAAYLVGR